MFETSFARLGLGIFIGASLTIVPVGCADREVPRTNGNRAEVSPSPSRESVSKTSALAGARLEPEFFAPTDGYPITEAMGLNAAGDVVGYSVADGSAPWPSGGADAPFVAMGNGGSPIKLPKPFPTGVNYPMGINDAGFISGFGGPSADAWNYNNASFIYRPDRTYFMLPIPSSHSQMAGLDNTTSSVNGLPGVYGIAIAKAGSLGAWHFEGNAQDAIGATSFSSPPSTGFVTGRYGQGLTFDGNACLSTTATTQTAAHFTTGVTMMAWVKPTSAVCSGDTKVVVQRGWDYAMLMGCDSGHASLSYYFYGLGGAASLAGNIPLDEWSHVAVSWDHNHVRRYVNGALVATNPLAGAMGTNGDWVSIGCWGGGAGRNFTGVIDEVLLFKQPMGTDQVGQFKANSTNYQAAPTTSETWNWARYVDDFFDVIGPPAGSQYSMLGYGGPANVNGVMAGVWFLTDGSTTGMIYTPTGGLKNVNELLEMGSDWNIRSVSKVNASGLAVGWGSHGSVANAIYRMDIATGEIIDLGRSTEQWISHPANYVVANDINVHGDVAISMYDNVPFWAQRAMVYTDDFGLINLTDYIDPSSGWVLHHAASINDDRVVIGWAHKASTGERRGYRLKLPGSASGCTGQPNGTACNLGNPCVIGDSCRNGTCVPGSPVVCVAQDVCHAAGVCNPTTGVCSNPPVAGGYVCEGSTPVTYHLSNDGKVSIGIYDSTGRMVRELTRALPQAAGDHTVPWDGLDRTGQALAPGSYTWKLLSTPGLTSHFIMNLGDNYPTGATRLTSSGPGSHVAPSTVATDGTNVYVAANGSENIDPVMVKLDSAGARSWTQHLPGNPEQASDGARALAVDDGEVFLLGHGVWNGFGWTPQQVFVTTASTGVDVRDFVVTGTDSPFDDMHGATDMDVSNGVIVVAYQSANMLRWYNKTGTKLDEAVLEGLAPRAVAVDSDGTVYVSTGGLIKKLTMADHTLSTVVSADLTGAGHLDVYRVGSTPYLLVFDDSTKQVKRFSASGSLLAVFGAKEREEGVYVATNFREASDLTADGTGGFYVAETYSAPRRIAHLSSSGTLIKEWYGGQPWASGAAFDPDDPAVVWMTSAQSADKATSWVMRLVLDYASTPPSFQVHSTYKYVTPDHPGMADSRNEGKFIHVYKPTAAGAGGNKYLVPESVPSVHLIDEANWRLVPAMALIGAGQWNDEDGDGVVDTNTTEMKAFPTGGWGKVAHHIEHVDANLNHYYIENEDRKIMRHDVIGWTPSHAPIYGDLPGGEFVANAPARYGEAGRTDVRWTAFLFHDVVNDQVYGAFNGGTIDWGTFADSFMQKWTPSRQPVWAVGEVGPALRTGYAIYTKTDPGVIYSGLRGIAGRANGCIIATDFNGGWTEGEHAQTYAWDNDGLFAGGLMDAIDLSVAPASMYRCSGELAHGAVYELPNHDVYFAANYENNIRLYKVTGWNGWERHSGTVTIGTVDADTGRGLTGAYFDNKIFTDQRTTRIDGPINMDWGSAVPAGTALTSADTYSVRWSGFVRPTYGPSYAGYWTRRIDLGVTPLAGSVHATSNSNAKVEFRFRGTSIDVIGYRGAGMAHVTVSLDGTVVDADRNLTTGTSGRTSLYQATGLSSGDHKIVLQSRLVDGGTLMVDAFTTDDGTFDDEGIPYTFYVSADDGAQLWVGNVSLINDWDVRGGAAESTSVPTKLLRNDTPIQLSYFKDVGGSGSVRLQWSSDMESKRDVPAAALFPTARSATTEQINGAEFIAVDNTIHGDWIGDFGSDGWYLASGANLPASLNVHTVGVGAFVPGPPSDTDTRYLQNPGGIGRTSWVMGCGTQTDCEATNGMNWDLNFSDAAWHQVAIYTMEEYSWGPVVQVEVHDVVGHLLSSEILSTNYQSGVYLKWKVRGHVKITVKAVPTTGHAGMPAVYGLFFDPAPTPVSHLEVRGNGLVIADGAATADATHATHFGTVAAGHSAEKTFTIANTGTTALTLSGSPRIAIDGANAGEFRVMTQPSSATIAGGSSISATVRFAPLASGARTARLVIANDTDQPTYDFVLAGTGGP